MLFPEKLPLSVGSSSKELSIPDLNLPPAEEDQHDRIRKGIEEQVFQLELGKIETDTSSDRGSLSQ